jgi:putative tryptophan/tyrosine transport system substrate-binding protein
MQRREFIAAIGGAAAWPLSVGAQQDERTRRIGVLMAFDENDSKAETYLAVFADELNKLGWTDGRNLRSDIRWANGKVDRLQALSKELVELRPDVIFTSNSPETAALQRETQTIPIVFVLVGEPVEQGFVQSLARPGGNITGFIPQEMAMAGKWLELLTQVAPGVKRVAAMFNPDTLPAGSYYVSAFEDAAKSLKVASIAAPVHSDADIEAFITSFGREPGAGLVVLGDSFMLVHRAPVLSLAAQNDIPAIYFNEEFVRDGGLLSYGPDYRDIFRRAAPYVDRILRGTKPADLPVQAPVKFNIERQNRQDTRPHGATINPAARRGGHRVVGRPVRVTGGLADHSSQWQLHPNYQTFRGKVAAADWGHIQTHAVQQRQGDPVPLGLSLR